MARKEKVDQGGAEGGGQPNVLRVSPEIRAGRTETRKISFSKSMICVGVLVCFRRAAENGCIMHLCVGCCSSARVVLEVHVGHMRKTDLGKICFWKNLGWRHRVRKDFR